MADDNNVVSRVAASLDLDIAPAQDKLITLGDGFDQLASRATTSYELMGRAQLDVVMQTGSQMQQLTGTQQARIQQIELDGELKRQMSTMAFQQSLFQQKKEFNLRMETLEADSQTTRDALMQAAALQTLAIMSQADAQKLAIIEESAAKQQALELKMEQAAQQHEARMSNLKQSSARDYVKWWSDALKEVEAMDKAHYDALLEDQSRALVAQQAANKEYVQFWTDSLRQMEVVDKAHFQALQDDRDRDLKLQSDTISQQMQQIKAFYDLKFTTAEESLKQIETLMQEETDYFQQNQDKQLQALRMRYTMQADLAKQATLGGQGSVRTTINGNNTSFSTGKMIAGMVGFSALMGAYEQMVQGMKDVESGAAGLNQVFEQQISSQDQLNTVTNDFVGIAQKYGQSINDVLQGAKQWGRQYKDIQTAMTLTNSSTLLAVVDNVSLATANRGLEATMNAMGLAADNQSSAFANSMRIVDSWSALAHKASVSADDLVQATERSAGAAHQAGVNFDQLQALATSAVRNTGLEGSNIGTMLKTLFTSIHTDKAQKELQNLDISLTQVGKDGQTEFKPVFDVLLELSQKLQTTDQSQQQLLKTISGGSQQYSKVASMLSDYNTIIDAYATSINSAGAAQQYAQVQMHTFQADLTRLQDTFTQLAASTDQNGLGAFLKGIVEGITNLITGLDQMSPAVGQTFLVIGGLVAALKSFSAMMNTIDPAVKFAKGSFDLLAGSIKATTVATDSQTVASKAATVASEAQAASSGALVGGLEAETAAAAEASAAFTALDMVSGGLVLVLGLVVTALVSNTSAEGEATQATRDHTEALQQKIGVAQQEYNLAQQKQQFMDTAIKQEQQLKNALDDTSLSAQNRNKITNDMIDLYHAVGKATGDEALQQVNASNVKNQSLTDEEKKLAQLVKDKKQAYDQAVQANEKEVESDINRTNQLIDDANQLIKTLQNETEAKLSELSVWQKTEVVGSYLSAAKDYLTGNTAQAETDLVNVDNIKAEARKEALDAAQTNLADLQNKKAQLEYQLSGDKLDQFQIDSGDLSGDNTGLKNVDAGWGATKPQSASQYSQPFKDQSAAINDALAPLENNIKQIETNMTHLTSKQDALSTSLKFGSSNMNLASEASSIYQKRLATLKDHQSALHSTNEQIRADMEKVKQEMASINPTGADPTTLSQGKQDALKSLQQELDTLTQKEQANGKAWNDDIKSMISASDEWLNSLYQLQTNGLKPLSDALKSLQNDIKTTQAAMKMDNGAMSHGDNSFTTITDYTKNHLQQMKDLQNEQKNLSQQMAAYKKDINDLQYDLNTLDKSSMTYDSEVASLTQKIMDDKTAMADLADQISQTNDAAQQLADTFENQIVAGLKSGYEAEQKYQDEQLKDYYDAKIKGLTDQKNAVDQLLQSLERQWQLQDANEKLTDLQQQDSQIKSNLDHVIVNADGTVSRTYDTEKALQVEQQIADQQTQISRDQQKQALEDQKSALEHQIQQEQDEYNQKKELLDQYWQYRISQDQLQQEADRLKLKDGYAKALLDAQQFAGQMQSIFNSISMADINTGGSIAGSLPGYSSAGSASTSLSDIIAQAGKDWNAATTQAQKDAIHQSLQNELQGSGATYNSNTGEWALNGTILNGSHAGQQIAAAETGAYIPDNKEGLIYLHPNEVVANSPLVDNFKVVPSMIAELRAKVAEAPRMYSGQMITAAAAAQTINNQSQHSSTTIQKGNNTFHITIHEATNDQVNRMLDYFDAV